MAIDMGKLFAALNYKPHAGQKLFHQSKARFKVVNAGRRGGKSTSAARDIEPDLMDPDKKLRWWIVGPTYDLGEKEFRVLWDDLIADGNAAAGTRGMRLGLDKRVKKRYNKKSGDMFIEFPWGTRVEVRSADHPENLVGESLNGAIMSEAAKHRSDTWNRFIMPALSDKRGKASFPSTPEGRNWYYNLWLQGQDPTNPLWESWHFPSWTNTSIYPGGENDPEIEVLRRTLSYEEFEQEIAANFTTFVGKIFSYFDESVNVIPNRSAPLAELQEPYRFNPEWPNYMAIDWGFTNPCAAIEFQVSPNGTVYVWREHYLAYTTLNEHINIWKTRENPPGYHLTQCFGDCSEPNDIATVSREFAPCAGSGRAKENWREGIDLMNSLMKPYPTGSDADEFGTPQELSHFYVSRECPNVIRELTNYRAKSSPKGTNVPEFSNKVSDHSVDALRYGMMHVFVIGAYSLSDVYDPNDHSQNTSQLSTTLWAPPTMVEGSVVNVGGVGLLDDSAHDDYYSELYESADAGFFSNAKVF